MPPTLPERLVKTWVILPVSTVIRRVTTQQSVLSQRKTKIPWKTSDSLGNLRVNETNVDATLEATLEQIPCIRKVNAIHTIFAKELGLWARPIT